MTGFRRRFGLAAVLAGLALGCPALALAQRPATPPEFAAVNRLLGPSASSLHDRLQWVRVSTRGPANNVLIRFCLRESRRLRALSSAGAAQRDDWCDAREASRCASASAAAGSNGCGAWGGALRVGSRSRASASVTGEVVMTLGQARFVVEWLCRSRRCRALPARFAIRRPAEARALGSSSCASCRRAFSG
jgi:hypothetical protein